MANAPDVVVAEEGYQAVGVCCRSRVVGVLRKKFRQLSGWIGPGGESAGSALESEIQDGGHVRPMNELRENRRVRIIDLAEDKKISASRACCLLLDCRDKALPELVVDVLDGVQSKSGNCKILDPSPSRYRSSLERPETAR